MKTLLYYSPLFEDFLIIESRDYILDLCETEAPSNGPVWYLIGEV